MPHDRSSSGYLKPNSIIGHREGNSYFLERGVLDQG
jgi:hypothetical protein